MEETLVFLQERYDLTKEKIAEISGEGYGDGKTVAYFKEVAAFLQLMDAYYRFVKEDGLKTASLEELKEWNQKLFLDILPQNYENSFANPAYAVAQLGEEYGKLLCALYAEVRSMIVPVTEQKLEEILIRAELFVEVYSAFEYEWQESRKWPAYESLKQILYWYVSDYSEIVQEESIRAQVVSEGNYALDILRNADLSDLRYLYQYGDFEQKKQIAKYLVKTAQTLGIEQPKVALIAPSEQLLPKVISSVESAELSALGQNGELGDGIFQGPLALDVAIDMESVQIKKLTGPVAGDADCLLFPNIESGNVFFKACSKFGGAELAAMVAGPSAPCVLTSRGDSTKTKLYSIALACLSAK